jgi:hypothetical protein
MISSPSYIGSGSVAPHGNGGTVIPNGNGGTPASGVPEVVPNNPVPTPDPKTTPKTPAPPVEVKPGTELQKAPKGLPAAPPQVGTANLTSSAPVIYSSVQFGSTVRVIGPSRIVATYPTIR